MPVGSRPRLLMLTPDFPPERGGIQQVTDRLAGGLLDWFDVRVVALDTPGARAFDAQRELTVRRSRSGPGGSAPARAVGLNGGAAITLASFRPQLLLSAHILASPAASLAGRLLGARVVQYFYAKEIPDKPRLSRFAAREADAVVSISSYTSQLLEAAGVAMGSVVVIPPGVDLPAEPDPLPVGRPTFITVARLRDRYKGHDILIRSLGRIRERVPDVEWVVLGEGPLRPELASARPRAGRGGRGAVPRLRPGRGARRVAASRTRHGDAEPPARRWTGRGGVRNRLPRGRRVRQAGRRG